MKKNTEVPCAKKDFPWKNFFRTAGLCLVSFAFLRLAFPCFDLWIFSWFALVPFFFALDGKSYGRGFLAGYFLGLLFFWGTLYWFVHVTFLGSFLLMLYLPVYFGFFGWAYRSFSQKSLRERLLFLPSSWVALEYLRSHLFSGFGWVTLGHSQYQNLPIIQIADWTGVYGISFLVVLVNVVIKESVDVWLRQKKFITEELKFPSLVVVLLIGLSIGYGFFRIKTLSLDPQLKASVIQGNISLEQRWAPSQWENIVGNYLEWTAAAAGGDPDLIIWPETSYPGFFSDNPELIEQVKDFVVEKKIPILMGAVTQTNELYFNSALLISQKGRIDGQYDKVHLVPFGEYIPFRKQFPFLEKIVPIDDFSSGGEYTQLAVTKNQPQQRRAFGTLICFEDTVPQISRQFVLGGAQFLVNITNDAWFLDSPEPYMHLQASIFRAIENRRSLVRSANTGVSGFIDPLGRLNHPVQNSKGKKTLVAGYSSGDIFFNSTRTFYTKFGDIFTYLCFGCILLGLIKKRR